MKTYRIGKTRYIEDISGKGAFLYGGRWNFKGYPLLYTSSSRSLAVLENLVHIGNEPGQGEYSLLTLDIPYKVSKLGMKYLFLSRRRMEKLFDDRAMAQEQIQAIGTAWLKSMDSVVLRVPSAVIPEEDNLLINPLHPEFQQITIVSIKQFDFDKRLFFPKLINP